MKNLLVGALLCAALVCTTQRSNAGDFVLLTGEYPPYTSESIDAFGIASQIVAEALEASDCGVEMSFKPWARALAEAGNDQANGTFPWAFTEERAETFLYSDPLYNAGIYLFARAGDEIDFKADEDLQGLDLCLPISYSDKRVQPMVEAGIVTLSRPQDMDACYRMLAGGRTDLVVNNDAVGKAEITRLFGSADDFKILPNALRTTVHHVLVSKTHPDAQTLLAAVNGGLAKLKEQGRIEEIFLEQLQ